MAFMIFNVQTTSLKQLIADEIKRRILYGELEFGQKISENSFAQELETKRTPVREAFILLQGENLVSIVPQKGTFVFTFTEEEISQMCDFRYVLEAASLDALQKRGEREHFITEMTNTLQELKKAFEEDDMLTCEKHDAKFHEQIINYSGNKFLISSYTSIADRVNAIRYRSVVTKERFLSLYTQHEKILKYFCDGNIKQCKAALEQHLHITLNRVLNDPVMYERILQKKFPGKAKA